MNKVSLAAWWKLTDNGFPTRTQVANALKLGHKGIGKYLKSGQRSVGQDRLQGLLGLDQPEGANEYLEALIRGAPPGELSEIEARATAQKKGPAPTQKTEEEPNPSQGQSSSNGAPNLQTLPERLDTLSENLTRLQQVAADDLEPAELLAYQVEASDHNVRLQHRLGVLNREITGSELDLQRAMERPGFRRSHQQTAQVDLETLRAEAGNLRELIARVEACHVGFSLLLDQADPPTVSTR